MNKWMTFALGAGALAGAAYGTSMAAKVNGVPIVDMVAERLTAFLAGDEEPEPAPEKPTLSEFDKACETLGLPNDRRKLSRAVVDDAVKQFLKINHPDRFAHLGKEAEQIKNRLCQYARVAADTIINSLDPRKSSYA